VFNTSRGIIVTADLVSAMNTGKVLGGIDVLEYEKLSLKLFKRTIHLKRFGTY
jgi:phosphoglycerate dehydrogenase-like enzyme